MNETAKTHPKPRHVAGACECKGHPANCYNHPVNCGCTAEVASARDVLLTIRDKCSSDPADFETAFRDIREIYGIVNNALEGK